MEEGGGGRGQFAGLSLAKRRGMGVGGSWVLVVLLFPSAMEAWGVGEGN